MIPEEVLNLVKNALLRETIFAPNINALRDRALQAIKEYKEEKRKCKEFDNYLNILKTFLDEHKAETTKN